MDDLMRLWNYLSQKAIETSAVDMTQGFADFDPPSIILDAFDEVARNPSSTFVHQYTRKNGHPRLVNVLAKLYSNELNLSVEPTTEVLITAGAQQALYCAISALAGPNDEIIVFEPFFTLYERVFKGTKVKAVYVTLELNHSPRSKDTLYGNFTFDRDELESKFNKRTKLFLLNNPNNPSGKVFTRDELKFIANLCIKHNVIVLSDEVYYRMIHPPKKHIYMASLPGMWKRTITIGSAGKCFSVTGWKVGWCVGPEALVSVVGDNVYDMYCSYVTPLQEAVAIAFENEMSNIDDKNSYVNTVSKDIMDKFKKVASMLSTVGMIPIFPESGYFLLVDISNVEFPIGGSGLARDAQFSKWMLFEHGISSLPMCIFLSRNSTKLGDNTIRLCCYKSDKTLEKAENAFKFWKKSIGMNAVPSHKKSCGSTNGVVKKDSKYSED